MSTTAELPRASAQAGYYDLERPEVIALIPAHARRVLELGCAGGACGARVKRERGATVVGVELLPEPAEVARTRLDRVIVGDCESMDFAEHFTPGEFDAIVVADVLEHLRDPEKVLARLHPYLAPGGAIVASIPNVRNWAVVAMLAGGDFTYQEAGLLDRTHIHFFTRREIQRAFGRGGYQIEAIQYVKDPRHSTWVEAGRPAGVNLGGVVVQTPSPEDAEELFVYQFLVRAVAAPAAPFADRQRPLVSIVIPVRNQLAMTDACVASIREHTPGPLQVVVVDNGSDDGTPAWAAAQPDVEYVRNDRNRGFAAACNQGLAAADGEYVVLLNNDTLVTAGWIDALLAPMVRDPKIGLTGPRSNQVYSAQVVAEARYGADVAAMHRFAADWQLRHAGTGFAVRKLVGFCLAIRRELLDAIGGLDERFGVGNFEDDDYCIRAMLAGYRCWVAGGSFVHHWGSQTFKSERIDYGALIRRNWRIFSAKWAIDVDDPTEGWSLDPVLSREATRDDLYRPLPASAAPPAPAAQPALVGAR